MPTTRRHFLNLAAGTVASATLSRVMGATPPTTPSSGPSLGFSLYGMKSVPLPEAVSHCARIGYANIELALIAGFPTELSKFSAESRKDLRRQTRALGVNVSSLLANLSLAGTPAAQAGMHDLIQRAAELAHQLDDGAPPLLQTVLGGKPENWENTQAEMAERLHAWASIADRAGITMAVKAHVSSAVNTPERLLWLHKKVNHPRLTLAYDFSHFDAAGLSLETTLRSIAPAMRFIHVKDVARGEKPARFLLPGEGSTDYAGYFRLLEELNYRGPVVVEVSSQIFSKQGYDPVGAAEKSYAVLAKAMAEKNHRRGGL
jgi:sugar phosphate isomerase/epimerase